jgi:NADH dehydrogenase
VVRPSIVFGPEDIFFNRFASIAKWSPAVPIVGGSTRFQPVFVGDVADFVAEATDGNVAGGATYELGGPEIKTFRELMQQMLAEIGRKRPIVDLPLPVARLQARLMSVLPNPPLTLDQIKLLARDNVVSAEAESEGRTFRAVGLAPHSLAAILPTYLWVYRSGGQFAPSNAS